MPPTSPDASNTPPANTSELYALHVRLHRVCLGVLLACAVGAVFVGFPENEPPPDRGAVIVALGLAVTCIIGRRLSTSPMVSPRTEFGLGLVGLFAGAALGALGCALAWQSGATRTGLAYAAAAFILCARPPTHPTKRVRRQPLKR